MQMFEVGGCVRDEILGIPSKDIDFSVVLDGDDLASTVYLRGVRTAFEVMESKLDSQGFRLIEEARKPEFLTARGFFPKNHTVYPGMPADFVLARSEAGYADGRRPDVVIPGTLEDDLARRDFTMNAIAKAADGTLIDPFDGQGDIERRLIRAVGDPFQRIVAEDALRGMRALRFSIQKNFDIDEDVQDVLNSQMFRAALRNIAIERVQKELDLMFAVSTVRTIRLLQAFDLISLLFNVTTGLRLMPTMKG